MLHLQLVFLGINSYGLLNSLYKDNGFLATLTLIGLIAGMVSIYDILSRRM